MEQETILCYYPMKEWNREEHPAIRHRWQTARLQAWSLEEREDNRVAVCPVPTFYYRKKEWKAQTLYEAMENVLYDIEGMADTFLHPAIERMLEEKMRERWRPRTDTLKRLTAGRLAQKAQTDGIEFEQAFVWFGTAAETDLQMEMTWELLLPYLPRINRCIFFYEAIPGVDITEEMGEYLDDYYYEYGLVVQTEAYGAGKAAHFTSYKPNERTDLCLDFRKDNLYRTSWKYLDTMIKNRYDRLVN